jgi:hypothetical protein
MANPKAVKGITRAGAKTDKLAWALVHPGAMKCSV